MQGVIWILDAGSLFIGCFPVVYDGGGEDAGGRCSSVGSDLNKGDLRDFAVVGSNLPGTGADGIWWAVQMVTPPI